jgi:alkanesulfonate monooxygenase SsuD/methylene tetrahydromethanopterin reductase-like flavin-dependent oxidoreductase (luciferase family)
MSATTTGIRFGLKLGGQDTSAADLREVWRIGDEAGFDHLWCLDMFIAFGKGGPDRPIFEGWALQAAMATATKRARIGCTFTGNNHRPPWMLAKLAVTVDHLSGGRLELGLGSGYVVEGDEQRMYGIPGTEERVGRFAESLECLKLLWTRDRVDFTGRYYTLRDAIANPKPVQKPHPPIWIGGAGQQLLRLVARHADVWNCPGGALEREDGIVVMSDRHREADRLLDEACREIGRDPATIRRCVQITWAGKDRDVLVENCARWIEDGFTEIIVYLHPRDAVRGADVAAVALADLRTLGPASIAH